MDVKIIEQTKQELEIEIDDDVLPNVLANNLIKKKVDAYFYDPHPLLPGFRLNISSSKAKTDLKKAVGDVEKDLKEFSKLLKKELK